MANYSSMFGSHNIPNRVWRPHVEVSQDNVGMVPPEELIVDQYLPTLGIDPHDPAGAIVIPSGRFVSIGYSGGRGGSDYRFARTDTGKTTLTLHDGKNLTPVGFSINNMYKDSEEVGMLGSNTVKFKKGFVAEVPHVTSINDGHGTLKAGDFVTGYWGSTTSTSVPSYLHRGKPVKWNARKVYAANGAAASAVHELTSAIYPGIEPRIIGVFNNSGALIAPTATLTYDANMANWAVSFTGTGSSTAQYVIYDYGQDTDQIGGEVLRIQSITDILSRDDYLKWVTYAPADYLNYPPAMQPYPITQVGTGADPDVNSDWEVPDTVTAGSSYRVQNYPVSVRHPFLIAFKGTLVDINGETQTYTDWTILPYTAVKGMSGYFYGTYHNVNWRTGLIELGSNITSVTSIKVLYSYITDWRAGAVQWGEGVVNLTDGSNLGAGKQGTPSNLNLSDVVAALRIIVD